MPYEAPVKIAHVVLSLNMGGLERVVLHLLTHLDRARFAPLVCALDEPGTLAPELARLGVPLVVLGRSTGLDPRLAIRLARTLAREDVRVVHTHNPSPHLYGALAARLAGARVVHTKHGRNQPDVPRKVLLNRLASALSDRVVAVSDDAAEVATAIERVDAAKVVTIRNGVDTAEFCPGDRAAARARLGVPEGGLHIGCVARLDPIKDHETLLRAFARLRAWHPDARLTLVGAGPSRPALEALARELRLGDAAHFAGERTDVAAILPAFDVFALSSRSEGISLTLLEAASASLPIVATRVGGNAEVVADGQTGLLVRPADPEAFARALARLAETGVRVAFGAAGRAAVERRYGAQRMADAYHDLYTELLHP